MRAVRGLALLALAALAAGCFHATVDTGATPSPEVVKKSFASSWIYGLVPPSTVETAAKCPNGPARVETQLSFVNQLVHFLTLGIYTPMEITVTCAPAPGVAAGTTGSATTPTGDSARAGRDVPPPCCAGKHAPDTTTAGDTTSHAH